VNQFVRIRVEDQNFSVFFGGQKKTVALKINREVIKIAFPKVGQGDGLHQLQGRSHFSHQRE
jgi:hypothetical protein